MYRRLAALCVVILVTVACQSARKTLGFEKRIPDEFRVISNQPLNVPPDFHLRPPTDKKKKKEKVDAREIRETLIGDTAGDAAVDNISDAENTLLKRAKTFEADPNIKEKLKQHQDQEIAEEQNKSWWEKIVEDEKDEDPIVDSVKERERIVENEKEGKAATDGETPTVEQKKSNNVLKRIFDW